MLPSWQLLIANLEKSIKALGLGLSAGLPSLGCAHPPRVLAFFGPFPCGAGSKAKLLSSRYSKHPAQP